MTTNTPQSILQAATQAFQRDDIEVGARLLDQYLALEPNNAGALDMAAQAALRQGELPKAGGFAQRAVSQKALAPYVLTWAEVLKAKGDLPQAANYFTKVLAKLPQEYRALMGLGDIYETNSYRQLALQCYETALTVKPDNLALAIKTSNLYAIPDLPRGLTLLEKVRPGANAPLKQKLAYLSHLVTYKEWAVRVRYDLMPYHVTRLDEQFFKYAAPDRDEYEALADQILIAEPSNKAGISAKASCLFSRGKRHEAEPFYRRLMDQKSIPIYDNIAFAADHYRRIEKLSAQDLSAKLPPLIDVQTATFSGNDIIYLSCNYEYYVNFARPMLLSINDVSRAAQVHLHIMDGNDDELAAVKAFCAKLTKTTFAITAERPGVADQGNMPARCYYHAIRFIRLLHHLRLYQKTLWLMDVDALLHRDPQPLFAQMGSADVAFRARPGRWEPWNQFNASVIGIRPTERALRYLHLIAAYIADFYAQDRLRWGIDQLAMYGVYEFLKDEGSEPSIHLLDNRAVDYEYYDDGFVWCNSGRAKFLQLQQMEKGAQTSADPLRAKYVEALMKYGAQLS